MQPHSFTHAALQPVSDDRFTHGAGHRKTNTRTVLLAGIRQTKCREKRARPAESFVVNFAELAAAEYPVVLGEAEPGPVGGNGLTDLRLADSAFVADSQLVAALRPAARQHGTAVFRLHAFTESMRLRALPVIRLERSLWHFSAISAPRRNPSASALRWESNFNYRGRRLRSAIGGPLGPADAPRAQQGRDPKVHQHQRETPAGDQQHRAAAVLSTLR